MDGKIHVDDESTLATIVASVTTSGMAAIAVSYNTGTNVIIWQDGKIVEVPPETIKINQ
jgi:hypothetical protein